MMNWLLITFLIFFILHEICEFGLVLLNNNFVKKHRDKIPEFYQPHIDTSTYQKSVDYSLAKANFGLVMSLLGIPIIWLVILSGGFATLDAQLSAWVLPNSLHYSVLYCGVIGLLISLLGIPSALYSTFVIEKKFGFNKTTPKLFVIDYIKGLLLTAILGIPIAYVIFWLVQIAGGTWWLYAFAVIFGFQFLLQALYPTVIAPLFNRFTPLPEGPLKQAILDIAKKVNFTLSGIFTIDGSKRSSHSNAYFAGIGKFRRIVLFDTLSQQMTQQEIVAILAHEMGHNIKKHVQRNLLLSMVLTLVGFWCLDLLMNNADFYLAFGAGNAAPHKAFVLFGLFSGYVTFILTPWQSYLSRKYEYEADQFAKEAVGSGADLASSLVKLTKENLSNLTPHPWFSFYHYSHPTTVERVRALGSLNSAP